MKLSSMGYREQFATAEAIVRTLQDNGIEADDTFTAAAGQDYGYVAAYKLYRDEYAVAYGDNGSTDYAITDDISDLGEWLIHELDEADGIIERAQVYGIDAPWMVDYKAVSDDIGSCRILATYSYYGPADKTMWVDNGGQENPLEFASYADADKWIDEADEGIYRLSHNESGRPTYTIIRWDN